MLTDCIPVHFMYVYLWLIIYCTILHVCVLVTDIAQEIAVDDINGLESEFMALQHSVQK